MSFEKLQWVNRDKDNGVTGTKLNAANLNRIEDGISTLDTALAALSAQVSTIDPSTGTGLTEEQSQLLSSVSQSLKTVQDGLDSLTKKFESHVHSNEAGETTGPVVIEENAAAE